MNILNGILDFFFPPVCLICSERAGADRTLCTDCYRKFIYETFEHCPICGQNAQKCSCGTGFARELETEICGKRFYTMTFYKSRKAYGTPRITEQIIYNLKEKSMFSGFIAAQLSGGIASIFTRAGERSGDWIITYPPRSAVNYTKYGFDQGEEIARRVAKNLKTAYKKTFIRAGMGIEQKYLTQDERMKNADTTLVPIKHNIVKGGKYIVIDDIITTGATVTSMAKALRRCGADEVFPVVLARTMMKNAITE